MELLKLHLGCGDRYINGFVNIDIQKLNTVDVVADVINLPYDNIEEIVDLYDLSYYLEVGDSDEDLQQNRRIELKLTSR